MKYLLLMKIKLYWKFTPESKRRKCLFKTSCSNYVYEKTKSEGLFSGLIALRFRIKNCNPNHSFINVNNELLLITSTNKIFKESELNTPKLKS